MFAAWSVGMARWRVGAWLLLSGSELASSGRKSQMQSQTFWRNKRLKSNRIQHLFIVVCWWEDSLGTTFKIWGLKGRFIFTPVKEPDCSSDSQRWLPLFTYCNVDSWLELKEKCTLLHECIEERQTEMFSVYSQFKHTDTTISHTCCTWVGCPGILMSFQHLTLFPQLPFHSVLTVFIPSTINHTQTI